MNKTKILITGGGGFIGSQTAKKLKELGYSVKLFEGDVCRVEDWGRNMAGGEVIFHFAGVRTESEEDFKVNALGTENLFLAAKSSGKIPQKVILVSSCAVYVGSKPPYHEEMAVKPATIYGQSKLKAENSAQKLAFKLKIPLVILRYATVIGPGIREKSRMSGPLARWVKAGFKGEPIKVNQGGDQSRPYVHIEDVVSANFLALEKIREGIFNVAGRGEIKLKTLARWVWEATGGRSEIVVLSGKPTPDDPKDFTVQTEKIRRWGWRPVKSAKEAVEEFVEKHKN